MCITASVILMEQRIQLEQEVKEKNEKLQKKIDVRIKKLQDEMKSNTKRLKGEELKVEDLNNLNFLINHIYIQRKKQLYRERKP